MGPTRALASGFRVTHPFRPGEGLQASAPSRGLSDGGGLGGSAPVIQLARQGTERLRAAEGGPWVWAWV